MESNRAPTAEPEPAVRAATFRYERGELTRPKHVRALCRTPYVRAAVQIVRDGGETNLHSHTHLDGIWFVLAGRARFYTAGDEVIADLGPHEGVLIPKTLPYWFESVGEEPLEIFQIEATDDVEHANERIDYAPLTASTAAVMADLGEVPQGKGAGVA